MRLFVDDLTHVDFSYLDPERGLVGESWAVRLELDGSLNDEGMICDFGIVKKRVKAWFDAGIDHSLAIPMKMKNLRVETDGERTVVDWIYPDGSLFHCEGPAQAFELLELEALSPEATAHWCESRLAQLFPDEVTGLRLTLYPEEISGAFYHYSHGLQKHQGNCQRIAHGHRSPIHILIDGKRSPKLEQTWADHFRDIYIGSESHLQSIELGQCHFAYSAPQGAFELSLPQRCCYLLNTDSTVELIGQHLYQVIQSQFPENQVEVRAFEGIGKGSIAS